MSPGSLDVTVVRRNLVAVDEAIGTLRRHTGRPLEALDDADERWVVERGLQLCAQNALDVATHLVASEGRDAPDYASAIDELGHLGVVPSEFAARFRAVAGFRNVLVHGYLAVDLPRLHEVLNLRLADFVELARYVEAWLARPAK